MSKFIMSGLNGASFMPSFTSVPIANGTGVIANKNAWGEGVTLLRPARLNFGSECNIYLDPIISFSQVSTLSLKRSSSIGIDQ